jgi:hypothetical protein
VGRCELSAGGVGRNVAKKSIVKNASLKKCWQKSVVKKSGASNHLLPQGYDEDGRYVNGF